MDGFAPASPRTPDLLAVSRGDAPADLAIAGARVVNVFSGEILTGTLLLHGHRIAAVLPEGARFDAARTIDAGGAYAAPGFIDAHMHVESSMLLPHEFARLACAHGTTSAIFDPHEIANVLGIPGIRALMDDSVGAALRCYFALSSCVPSCHLETSGARLEAADLRPLFDDPRVVGLAEMMNFPGAVNADAGVLAKVNLGLSHGVVDGHAPGLRGRSLQAYLAAGISSDHECTSAGEAQEKLRLGMQIFIREGSAARNLEALAPLISPSNAARFCFCTDDRHPADLRDQGHIDHVVRKAIGLGVDPVAALTIASLNTARHYRLPFRGGLAPGWIADIVLFHDLRDPAPTLVISEGRVVACDGVCTLDGDGQRPRAGDIPRAPVRLPTGFDASRLVIRAGAPGPAALLRIIGMDPHQIVTSELRLPPSVQQGCYVADPSRDIAKLAVIERHRGSGAIGLGFVHGFGLLRGAIASTVGHDAHNLAVLGVSDDDMVVAARALAEVGGGLCAVLDGRVLATLPLPVAGLMSDQPAGVVIAGQRRVLDAARSLGIPHEDPFMPLSFLPLPVIPALKLSDQGLIDVAAFAPTTLEVGP